MRSLSISFQTAERSRVCKCGGPLGNVVVAVGGSGSTLALYMATPPSVMEVFIVLIAFARMLCKRRCILPGRDEVETGLSAEAEVEFRSGDTLVAKRSRWLPLVVVQ